jgi:hypothetical protein
MLQLSARFRNAFRNIRGVKAVTVELQDEDYARARNHAATLGLRPDAWICEAVNLVLYGELPETDRLTGRRQRLTARVGRCWWCGGDLGNVRTRRRRYCSDPCRVKAWRRRRRLETDEARVGAARLVVKAGNGDS